MLSPARCLLAVACALAGGCDVLGSDPATPAPDPPPPPPVATEVGAYRGFIGLGDGSSGASVFGHPVLVDGAGRIMALAGTGNTEGLVIHLGYVRNGDDLAVDADVRPYPTATASTGSGVGTLVNGGDLTIEPIALEQAGTPTGAQISFEHAYVAEESEYTFELPDLIGHYAATGDTDTTGAFDSDHNRFEMEIQVESVIRIGPCWGGVLTMAEADKGIVRIDTGPLACPTAEVLTGLMLVTQDQLFVLLEDESSARSYYGTFPRP